MVTYNGTLLTLRVEEQGSMSDCRDHTNHSRDDNGLKNAKRMWFCPHCQENVPNSTFYRHRAQFFDEVSKRWKTAESK